jgi:hypothetical protein
MQVTKQCGYCNKEFTMTPAVAERREQNSKSGKVFCSQQCGPAYNKEKKIRERTILKSTQAQEYLDGYFSNNIIGGGLATTDNIIYGGELNNRMKKDMNAEEMAKIVEANPDMTATELIELMSTVPATATAIVAETPAVITEAAPVSRTVGQAPSNVGKFPSNPVPMQPVPAQQNQVGITACDAKYWDNEKEFKQCAWSPEHNKYSYHVVDTTATPENPKGRGYIATANDCFRCNALGTLTERKLQSNFTYDVAKGETVCKTIEEYILSKKLENPL